MCLFLERNPRMENAGTKIPARKDILVIGAYGLIGRGVCRRLRADGHRITGLGRNAKTANRVLPDITWIIQDLSGLCDAGAWHTILRDVSVVVNCSGVLQDGLDDNLEKIHHHVVSALASACADAHVQLIQISATGVRLDAPTQFLASKARGDDAIRGSKAHYQILRPGLVLAPHAYGGTALLRMLAAVPFVQPIAMPQAQIQTVSLDDLTAIVSVAVDGELPLGFETDLVETEVHTLSEIVQSVRHWLGFGAAKRVIEFPNFLTRSLGRVADIASLAGWRSPLRSTALTVLAEGVKGEPANLSQFGLPAMSPLSETLANMPARAEDRLFARMALLAPIMVVALCLFWLASGLIGLMRAKEAAMVLETAGWPHIFAISSVVFWAIVDLGIAGAFVFRKYAPLACWAAIGVSLFYLVASTLVVPQLWLDPLGPLVKVIPGIVLALVARAALETR